MKRRGRKSLSQTPSPKADKIYGSKKNPKGSASNEEKAKKISLSSKTIESLKNKLSEFKKSHKTEKVNINDLKAVYRRGSGAYSSSHRPTISGGKPNTRNAWAMARVNKFLEKAGGKKVKKAYVQDDDLLKYEKGGEVNYIGNEYLEKKYGKLKKKNAEFEDLPEIYIRIGLPKKVGNKYLPSRNHYIGGLENGVSVFTARYSPNSKFVFVDLFSESERGFLWETYSSFQEEMKSGSKNKVYLLEGNPLLDGLGSYQLGEDYERLLNTKELKVIGELDPKKIIEKDSYNEETFIGEELKIYPKYEKGGLIAPNGKPSNLTAEQYKLVRTPEFKAWFGDWENDPENASKVVDENGEPLVVYRGMPKKRRVGNIFKTNVNLFGTKGIGSRATNYFAFYFTDNIEVAKKYGEGFVQQDEEEYIVKSYFLNVRKLFKAFEYKNQYQIDFKSLYDLATEKKQVYLLDYQDNVITNWDNKPKQYYEYSRTFYNKYVYQDKFNEKYDTYSYFVDWDKKYDSNQFFWRSLLDKRLNYNGIVFYETTYNSKLVGDKLQPEFANEFSKTYGVFEPTQIKLADGSNTTFDGKNPDIRYEEGGEVDDCINYIKENNSILNNGYYFDTRELSKLIDPYGQIPLNLDFTLITYNSDGQNNLDVINTINPIECINELAYFLNMDKSQLYTLVHYYIDNAKRITDINQIKTKKIVIIDRDKIVCENIQKYKDGGEVDEHKETYDKWRSLVNMSSSELKRFYDSEEGKKAGLSQSEANKQGIDSGRESARWIMKMKQTPKSKWTPNMWRWANKQISFISRMSGMKGGLYKPNGEKTRKHLALLIWGHNPKKYDMGGNIISLPDTSSEFERLRDILDQQGYVLSKKDTHLLKVAPSLDQIAEKHQVSKDYLEDQLKMGVKEEMEHTENTEVAQTIALHHLYEDYKYYSHLEEMMKKAKEEEEYDRSIQEIIERYKKYNNG